MSQLDPFNAFVERPERLEFATEGPLHGETLGVKDIFDVKGLVTGWGNPQRKNESAAATATAPSVQKLIDAGAQFVGKTQTDELAFSLMGQNSHFPRPINRAAPERVTGGSSSGSAAAVASGLASMATGSDTGGSIRAPASFCGLVGLRTTHGRISLEATMPLAPSLDTFGWFARDIDLYEKVGDVLLGPDTHGEKLGRFLYMPILEHLLGGEQETAAYRPMFGSVRAVMGAPRAAAQPTASIDELYLCFRQIQGAEAWASHGQWISERDRGLGPGVKDRFDYGSTIDSDTVQTQIRRRERFREELASILNGDGVLVLPTVPGAAPLASSSFEELQTYRERALRLLCLSGLSGFPQISLPIGRVNDAPFGISLIGPAGSDRQLIALGREIIKAAEKND
ncbi:MAG: amidase [Phyllobacterium sp.]